MSKTITEDVKRVLEAFAPERHREIQVRAEQERAADLKALRSIEEKQAEEWTKNSTAFNKANDAWEALWKQAQAADSDRRRLFVHRSNVNFSYDHQKNQIGRRLRETAPECLARFSEELEAELETTRRALTTREEPTGQYFRNSQKPVLRILSNRASVEARLAVLLQDLHWVRESAALEFASEAQALPAIEERRAAWPELKFEVV